MLFIYKAVCRMGLGAFQAPPGRTVMLCDWTHTTFSKTSGICYFCLVFIFFMLWFSGISECSLLDWL